MSFTGIYFIICNAQHNKSHYKGEKKKKKQWKALFILCIYITSLCETHKNIQRNIKSKTQHRLFPTQKVVKTQQNHKIPPDSLSEGAFVTISHFDIHKSHYVVIRREPLKTHTTQCVW